MILYILYITASNLLVSGKTSVMRLFLSEYAAMPRILMESSVVSNKVLFTASKGSTGSDKLQIFLFQHQNNRLIK